MLFGNLKFVCNITHKMQTFCIFVAIKKKYRKHILYSVSVFWSILVMKLVENTIQGTYFNKTGNIGQKLRFLYRKIGQTLIG